jgi:hypothetical protein
LLSLKYELERAKGYRRMARISRKYITSVLNEKQLFKKEDVLRQNAPIVMGQTVPEKHCNMLLYAMTKAQDNIGRNHCSL